MYFLFLSFFLALESTAATPDALSVGQISSNNLSIQSLKQAEEGEKAKTGYLGRSFLPSLTLEVGQEKFQTGKYKTYDNSYGAIEARINLFKGGRDGLESDLRNIQARVAGNARDLAVREELNKVRKLQWEIIHNEALIKVFEQEKIQNSKLRDQAVRRAKSGISTNSDSLEFTIYDSEIEEAIESLQNENQILKLGLAPLIGIASEEIVFSESLEHSHDDVLLSSNYSSKQHPGAINLAAESQVFELQESTQNRWWTPSLDLYGGYFLYTLRDRDYLAQDRRDDTVVGLRLSFELFDGGKSYNQVTAIHYQAESKRLMARHQEKKINAQFLMLQKDLKHTHEVMHYVEDRIKKSKDYLKVTLQEYDRGVKNSLDALTAMQRYFRYEKQYLERKKEYQVVKTDLLALKGD